MYDMKPMAQSLASQGRYGDTMLVHMNPVEVAGLDAYTRKMGGGGLTVNPRTGQPEAFLPFLLGLGLQGLGMTALQAGLATGIGTAVATKDLGKGVLAGLRRFWWCRYWCWIGSGWDCRNSRNSRFSNTSNRSNGWLCWGNIAERSGSSTHHGHWHRRATSRFISWNQWVWWNDPSER
jgi:hypothetical protein